MSEILLQTIVEKLETIEIGLLKENTGKDAVLQTLLKEIKLLQSEMLKLPLQFKGNSEKVNELLKGIVALKCKLDILKIERIKHSHHLHKGLWIVVGLFIFSLLLLLAWVNCINSKKAFETNDFKYRFLKVNGNPSLLKLLYQTDSLYKLDNDSFAKRVVWKEQHLGEQEKVNKPASEKKKNAGELLNNGRKYLSK